MSRKEKFKKSVKDKARKRVWKTGKKVGKAYLEYRIFSAVTSRARKKLSRKKKDEKEDR